jgi:hypothetical protein
MRRTGQKKTRVIPESRIPDVTESGEKAQAAASIWGRAQGFKVSARTLYPSGSKGVKPCCNFVLRPMKTDVTDSGLRLV